MNWEATNPRKGMKERAVQVGESFLAISRDNGDTGMYVWRLGNLIVAFELYHVSETGEQYIGFEEDDYQPSIVNSALRELLDSHPSRRAYRHGKKSHKLSNTAATQKLDSDRAEIVEDVLTDVAQFEVSLDRCLRNAQPLPWQSESQ